MVQFDYNCKDKVYHVKIQMPNSNTVFKHDDTKICNKYIATINFKQNKKQGGLIDIHSEISVTELMQILLKWEEYRHQIERTSF
jgi:hypothetical protein